jgi:6,7-dimethyl-8-ribityllumazine synthase
VSSDRPKRRAPGRRARQAVAGSRFAVIAARWNPVITERLLAGARAALRETGVAEEDIEVFRCPGAFEIPAVLRAVADAGRFAGAVCLGTILRGDTLHFDLVAGAAARGVAAVAAEGKLGVGFGVIACDTLAQAKARSSDQDNKGAEAARVAAEMAALLSRVRR